MPSSAVHTFADPDDYAAVFPAASIDLTITGRGQFIANVTRIDLHRLWMLRFSDNLPRVKHSGNNMDRACSVTARRCPRATSSRSVRVRAPINSQPAWLP